MKYEIHQQTHFTRGESAALCATYEDAKSAALWLKGVSEQYYFVKVYDDEGALQHIVNGKHFVEHWRDYES